MAIDRLQCTRCEYSWYPKSERRPQRCARCNSPYWDRQRRKDMGKDAR